MHLCSLRFNVRIQMYEQKNTNGEWDLVTIIEGHASWYRQNRLLHRILIYQYGSTSIWIGSSAKSEYAVRIS